MKYLSICLFVFWGTLCFAKDSPKLKNNGNEIVINDITIIKDRAEIKIKGSFATRSGILEYFLVGEEGKAYESAFQFSAKTKVSELNFALLLIGAQEVPFRELLDYQKQKDGLEKLTKKYPKSVFEIELHVYDTKLPLNLFLKDRENKHKTLTWVYTGGYFNAAKKYMADIDYCAIGIWADGSAPLNLFNIGSNPYSGDDAGFELIHPDDIGVKPGLPVELIIRKKQLKEKP